MNRTLPRWLHLLHEGVLAALAIIVIWLLTVPNKGWHHALNLAIWIVFAVDYFIRFALSKSKRRFVGENVLDLIAILPFDFARPLRAVRSLRLLRPLRAALMLWRGSATVRGILLTNHLGQLLLVTLMIIFLGGIAFHHVEPGGGSLGDCFWWSIVTTATVGYGDIAPKTVGGRILASVLMVVGIGTLGMVSGTIATYFLKRRDAIDPHIRHVQSQLDGWADMTPAQRRGLCRVLQAIAEDAEDPERE